MLYIITKAGQEGWHIGDHKKEMAWYKGLNPQYVEEIQADGDELELILSTCGNSIPVALKNTQIKTSMGKRTTKTPKRVQNWYGDHAKFIFKNVILGYEYL